MPNRDKMTWRRNPFTGDWESGDGRWEVSPRNDSGPHWTGKDRTGQVEPYTVRYLADVKKWCQEMGTA